MNTEELLKTEEARAELAAFVSIWAERHGFRNRPGAAIAVIARVIEDIAECTNRACQVIDVDEIEETLRFLRQFEYVGDA